MAIASLDPRWLVPKGTKLPEKMELPRPRIPREEQQEEFVRDLEIDPHLYYPADVDREPFQNWPDEGIVLEPRKMLAARGIELDDEE